MVLTPLSAQRLTGIAKRLVADDLLSADAAIRAQADAQLQKEPLVDYLVQHKLIEARPLALALAEEFGVPFMDLDAIDTSLTPPRLVDEKLIRRHHLLPLFKRGNRLFLAMADPTNLQALDDIKFHTSAQTEAILVEQDKLARAIDKYVESFEQALIQLTEADLKNLEDSVVVDEARTESSDIQIDDAPVVRFINKILLDALNKGASDIHFEPYEAFYRIRARLDGILSEVTKPPVALGVRLAARLKVMARLDIAERRLPQDGRIKLKLSKMRSIDFRVSTCPTLWGEKIVLRLLDGSAARLGIEELGFQPEQKAIYLKTLSRPQGMILVTGPTGSGKTMTLYTGLNILNTADRNISTAEDPAEINLPGVNQVNVHPKIGLTFAAALRAFLRQDPDVIMVGEIRDLETAEIAIKAAQTGHLVLSTLHTNDAPQTLTRLISMGIAPFNIASSVDLIIAQRLARRLCPQCRQRLDLPPETLRQAGFTKAEIPELVIYGPKGCQACNEGYKGRIGIYQVMPLSEQIGRIIMEGGNAAQIAEQASLEGVIDLRRAGLNKVKEGISSLEEINRITIE